MPTFTTLLRHATRYRPLQFVDHVEMRQAGGVPRGRYRRPALGTDVQAAWAPRSRPDLASLWVVPEHDRRAFADLEAAIARVAESAPAAVRAQLDAIGQDSRLSDVGRADARRRVFDAGGTVAQRYAELSPVIKAAREKFAAAAERSAVSVAHAILARVESRTPARQAWLQEIRATLRGLSPDERAEAIQAAIAAHDVDILEAVHDVPDQLDGGPMGLVGTLAGVTDRDAIFAALAESVAPDHMLARDEYAALGKSLSTVAAAAVRAIDDVVRDVSPTDWFHGISGHRPPHDLQAELDALTAKVGNELTEPVRGRANPDTRADLAAIAAAGGAKTD